MRVARKSSFTDLLYDYSGKNVIIKQSAIVIKRSLVPDTVFEGIVSLQDAVS